MGGWEAKLAYPFVTNELVKEIRETKPSKEEPELLDVQLILTD